MTELFTAVVGMSLKAIPVICVLFFLRLLLRRAPKKYSYVLWAVALFRLVCPVSVSSMFSLFNLRVDKVPSISVPTETQPTAPAPQGEIPADPIVVPDRQPVVEQVVVDPPVVETAPFDWEQLLPVLWIIGVAAVLGYTLWRVVRLYRRTDGAIRLEDNIWTCDGIPGPFVFGVIRPRIFLPTWLGEGERDYVLAHERFHICRLDPWVKALSQVVAALHWFNPMVWLMLWALDRDMEMSCDEGVLKGTDEAYRKDYSRTLLALGTARREFGPVLAFGTPAVKRRILNVLQWKRATRITVVFALLVLLLAGLTCCTDASSDREATYAERLYQAQTEYVGNNSAVSNLVGVVLSETIYRYGPDESNYSYPHQSIELATDSEPYGMTISIYRQEFGLLEREDAFRTAVLMLTLVDNLSRCTVELPLTTERLFMTVTVEQAETILNIKDLKSYCSSERKIETLLDMIGELERDAIPAYEGEQIEDPDASQDADASQWSDMAWDLYECGPCTLTDEQEVTSIVACAVGDGGEYRVAPFAGDPTYGLTISRVITETQRGTWDEAAMLRTAVMLLALVDDLEVCRFDYEVTYNDPADSNTYFSDMHPEYSRTQVQALVGGAFDLRQQAKTQSGICDLLAAADAVSGAYSASALKQYFNNWASGACETYSIEKSDIGGRPFIRLYEDGTYYFVFSMLSSHTFMGHYSERDGLITLMEHGGEAVYYFRRLDDTTIAFVAQGSSDTGQFSVHDIMVEDGDTFAYDLMSSKYGHSASHYVNFGGSGEERYRELFETASNYFFNDIEVEVRDSGLYIRAALVDPIGASAAQAQLYRAGVMLLAVGEGLDRVVIAARLKPGASQYTVCQVLDTETVEDDLGITNLKFRADSAEALVGLVQTIESYLAGSANSNVYGFEPSGNSSLTMTGLDADIVELNVISGMPEKSCFLYYVDPVFLGDWFEGKPTIEGDASWADEDRTILEFGFTMADPGVISEGTVAGPAAVFTVDTVSGKVLSVEIDQQDYQAKIDLTEEEIREAGFILAEIMWQGASLLSGE